MDADRVLWPNMVVRQLPRRTWQVSAAYLEQLFQQQLLLPHSVIIKLSVQRLVRRLSVTATVKEMLTDLQSLCRYDFDGHGQPTSTPPGWSWIYLPVGGCGLHWLSTTGLLLSAAVRY